MPWLERLWRWRRDQGLVLVAISVDRKPDLVEPFVERYKLTFPVALDPRDQVGRQFGARGLPTTAIIGKDGSLAALAHGARRWDSRAAVELIDALLAP